MRMIDADDIVYESIDSSDTTRYEYYYGTGILAVRKEDIDTMPTIELPERKKGKWINIPGFCTPGGDPVWACSECGKGVHVYGIEHRSYQADISDDQWKACPNCGAEMTGENNG